MKILFYVILGLFLTVAQGQESKQKKLDYLLIRKRAYHKRMAKKGYRIQVYNGSESTATEIKQDCEVLFPEIAFNLKYEAPDWKVQTGIFITRLAVDRVLMVIQSEYEAARVLFVKQ